MRTLALALPFVLSAAGGCIVYEGEGHADGMTGTIPGETVPGTETTEEPATLLSFQPQVAQSGTTFIGYLTASQGDLDLTGVEGVELFGDASLVTFDARPTEVVVTVEVPADAVGGEVDLLARLDDGAAVWLEAAFTVLTDGGSTETGTHTGTETEPCP